MTSAYENVYQYNEDFWKGKNEIPKIGIQISGDREFFILDALEDVWRTIDTDPQEAKNLVGIMASVLIAALKGNVDMFIANMNYHDKSTSIDAEIEELLNGTENGNNNNRDS